MSIQDLIRAAASIEVDENELEDLKQQLADADESYSGFFESQAVTSEFLSRSYSL